MPNNTYDLSRILDPRPYWTFDHLVLSLSITFNADHDLLSLYHHRILARSPEVCSRRWSTYVSVREGEEEKGSRKG